VIVLSDSPCERIGDLSDFEIEQMVGVRLAGVSLIKTATLLGGQRARVSKVMSVYKNDGKTTSAKRNSGRNSTLTERDRHTLRRIAPKNHTTTIAQVTAELNVHLSDHVSTKIA
jgi:transposase